MKLKCWFGFHRWNGCQCSVCRKRRDEQHNWGYDCTQCVRCGKRRAVEHTWNGCKCSSCAQKRDLEHSWTSDCEICSVCGKRGENRHDLSSDCAKCATCGKEFNFGTFTDQRDGREYGWIRIADHIMMGQNLAYEPEKGNCWVYEHPNYNERAKNVTRYGLLYDWETARQIAPAGWHLPTRDEWQSVCKAFKEYANTHFDQDVPSHISSYNIRAGYRDDKAIIHHPGDSYFWSSSEAPDNKAVGFQFSYYFNEDAPKAGGGHFDRTCGLSVILFRDF
jgi:uncharacterized protein (TIGR02145 family)